MYMVSHLTEDVTLLAEGVKSTQTGSFTIDRPIEDVFPLFSAEGEKQWAPGWHYVNPLGGTEMYEGYFFIVPDHGYQKHNVVFFVKTYDRDEYLLELYRIDHDEKILLYHIQCDALSETRTRVTVSVDYTAISDRGVEFVRGYNAAEHAKLIAHWERLLNQYFFKQ